MKKKLVTLFTSLMLIVTMLVLVCGCSSYSAIKKAFEKEGYQESEKLETYQNQVNEALDEEYRDKCSVHLFTKASLADGGIVLIFEFKSTKDLEDAIKDSKSSTLKEIAKDIQNSDLVNGNCVLFLNLSKDGLEIFKNA